MAESGGLRIETNPQNGTAVTPELPGIAAAFLVKFDNRKGYTVAWQRSVDGVQLDGVVDYKSLPSGLHNVEQDLVYFTHEEYAGVSAFLHHPGSQSERNARMLAVGVLIPLEHGKMGKSWRHADNLTKLAEKQIDDLDDHDALEQYWEDHRISGDAEDLGSSTDSPIELKINKRSPVDGNANGYQSSRRISTATVLQPAEQSLSPHHPALSLSAFLQQFGPLVFLLYRAALLRKRILLVCEAPVEQSCNFVYDLSVISALPRSLLDILPTDAIPDIRLRPLFSVGVQDIPELAAPSKSTESFLNLHQGWIACTTDDVLATKPELFDILVNLPSANSKNADKKAYPKIVPSAPELSRKLPKTSLRSTQRDARRYLNLRAGLQTIASSEAEAVVETVLEDGDERSIISAASSTLSRKSVVEPTSWSLMAYTSLVWWASAGEKRGGPSDEEEEEDEQDGALLRGATDDENMTREVAIVTYFHKLTNLIFTTVSDAISRADGDGDRYRDDEDAPVPGSRQNESAMADPVGDIMLDGARGEDEGLLQARNSEAQDEDVEVTQEDMATMGLDIWSTADRTFVEELIGLWWGRKAVVRGGRIECCGVRIL